MWLFYFLKGCVRPKIFLSGLRGDFQANFLVRAAHFPVVELAKSFGLKDILERQVKEMDLVVSSEVPLKILEPQLIGEFLKAGSCRLQLLEEKAFNYLSSFRKRSCLLFKADMVYPKNS